MKSIVFICYGGENLKKLNPNFRCVLELAEHLKKQYKVSIITDTNDSKINSILYNGINIVKVPTFTMKNTKILNLNKCNRTVIKNIIGNKQISRIIGIVSPFVSTIISLFTFKMMYKSSKTILYEFDPFAYNYTSSQNKVIVKIKKILENIVFKNVDEIWLTKELYNQYKKNDFSIFLMKINEIGIPLLSKSRLLNSNQELIDQYNSKPIKMIFVGTFYDDIRKPNYLIKLVKGINKNDVKVSLDMYGGFVGENSKQLIEYESNKHKNYMSHHGRVNNNKIPDIIKNADIIINIGNDILNQVPSKIFEYIESKKVVLNIASIENDTSEFYLKNYKLAILIKESIDENVHLNNMRRVITEYHDKKEKVISDNEIIKKFNQYTAESIAKTISNIIN